MALRVGWSFLFLLAISVAGYGLVFIFSSEFANGSHMARQIADRPLVTYVHFVFGPAALVLGAWQFWPAGKFSRPRGHRTIGQLYVLSCLLTGIAGLWMAFFSKGGMTAHVGFFLMAVLSVFTVVMGYLKARDKQFSEHQNWMIRSYALICSAITLRIQLGIGVPLLGYSFQDVYSVIAWASWVPNILIAEWIIHYRGQVKRVPAE
jgi:uncharacterized membrane protein